jgi:hypothetical protein
MTTFFRFAIQTPEHRRSEIWSFFNNKKDGCVYATRASMKDWLKVSFHETGACHIKGYERVDGVTVGTLEHAWQAPTSEPAGYSHLMRVIYDVRHQGAQLPRSDRVRVEFENWGGTGSVHLDVYAGAVDAGFDLPSDSTVLVDRVVGKTRRLVFALGTGGPQNGPPEPSSGAVIHLGVQADDQNDVRENMTGVWYSTPEGPGTLTMVEASAARFSLERFKPI